MSGPGRRLLSGGVAILALAAASFAMANNQPPGGHIKPPKQNPGYVCQAMTGTGAHAQGAITWGQTLSQARQNAMSSCKNDTGKSHCLTTKCTSCAAHKNPECRLKGT